MKAKKTELEELKILAELKPGEQRAVSTKYLCYITGLSTRQLRKRIHKMRIEGKIICSNTSRGGYYLPETLLDTENFVISMTRRGKSVFAASSGARKKLQEVTNE